MAKITSEYDFNFKANSFKLEAKSCEHKNGKPEIVAV